MSHSKSVQVVDGPSISEHLKSTMETNLNGELIIIGQKGCSINDISLKISKSRVLKDNRLTFGGRLAGDTNLDLTKLDQDYLSNHLQFIGFVHQVLEYVVADNGNNRKLSTVLEALEVDCEDKKAGETLRLHFNLPCMGWENPELKWSDLSEPFQKKVHTTLVESKLFKDEIEEMKPRLSRTQLIHLMMGKQVPVPNTMEVDLC